MKCAPLLAAIILVLLPVAQGENYAQPMLGVSWNTHEISVYVPDEPSWTANAIEQALTDWNAAQTWFIQTYFVNETAAKFTFSASKNPSDSLVRITYVRDMGQFWTGNTEVPTSTPPTNETMLIVLSRLTGPTDVLQVVEHELGHVLGLDHTQISVDLMYVAHDAYTGGEPSHPSTLNLYAVYLLGIGCTFSSTDAVNLPAQIPYIEWYPGIPQTPSNNTGEPINAHTIQTITEPTCPRNGELWQQPIFIVALTLAVLGLIVKRRRKKPPRPSQFIDYFER